MFDVGIINAKDMFASSVNFLLYFLNIHEVTEKINAGGKHVFGVYDAYIEHAIASLEAGSKGLSCIQGNYFPELIVRLCQSPAQNQDIQAFLSANMQLMHANYPTSAKYVLQKLGFPINIATRRKVGELSIEQMKDLDALIEAYHERF